MKGLKELLKKNLPKTEKGTYILVLNLDKNKEICIGKLGKFLFEKGLYFYVGSARGGFLKRVVRYFGKIEKKKWHIDYLLEYAEPFGIFFFDEFYKEVDVAKRMENLYHLYVRGFGSSDTQSKTHLFYTKEGG